MGRSRSRVLLGACLAGLSAAPLSALAQDAAQYALLAPARRSSAPPAAEAETPAPTSAASEMTLQAPASQSSTDPNASGIIPVDEVPMVAETPIVPRGYGGRSPFTQAVMDQDGFLPIPDRWRVGFPTGYRPELGGFGKITDPYNQNVLKGDYPMWGNDKFLMITATSDTLLEYRKLPTPSGVSSLRPESTDFFGKGDQYFVNQNFILSMAIFKGDAGYRPLDWQIKLTPVFNINYVKLEEVGLTEVDVRNGRHRQDEWIGLQEAFVEARLPYQSNAFDFTSLRIGIQPFVSDFKGFLFSDFNLGVRLFGNKDNNRVSYNLAWFHTLEKDTNSGLNSYTLREQDIFIANVFFQDSLRYFRPTSVNPKLFGYTTSFSFHANLDHSGDEIQLDENGFIVRPQPIGTIADKEVQAYYVGWGGDGHIGRFNVTHQFYQAFGSEDINAIAGRETDINAQFFAIEFSYDQDFLRFRTSFLYSSGDGDPDDGQATGFDSIFENPNFSGGQFSFWQRQAIALGAAGTSLKGRNSLIPSLRTSKEQGQANFVNPGLFMYNVGLDIEVTPKVKVITNATLLQFADTKSLQTILFDDKIGRDIGIDYSIGVEYRPFLNNNVIFLVGAAALQPMGGYKDLFQSATQLSLFTSMTLTY